MSATVEFSIDGAEFVLGKAERAAPSALDVEVVELVPLGDGAMPYVSVVGARRDAFETVLTTDSALSEFSVVEETDERALYRVEWNRAADTFVQVMVGHEVMLREARGNAESWTFQLQFPDQETLSSFDAACRDAGIEYTVDRLRTTPGLQEVDGWELTDAQRHLIERAHEEGYFDVPRGITLESLADELGISDQAANERLRRGLQSLIESTVDSEGPPRDE